MFWVVGARLVGAGGGREGAGDGRHVPTHRGCKALSLCAWQDLEGAPTGPPASTCPEQDAELKASVSVLKMRPFRNKPPLASLALSQAACQALGTPCALCVACPHPATLPLPSA